MGGITTTHVGCRLHPPVRRIHSERGRHPIQRLKEIVQNLKNIL